MDGSVAASHIERIRFQTSHGLANRAANGSSAQSELFEQLLSLNFATQPPPEVEPDPAASTPPVEDSSLKTDDHDESSPVEEEQETKDDQVVVASIAPVTPVVTDQPIASPLDKASDVETAKVDSKEKLCDLPKSVDNDARPLAVDAAREAKVAIASDAPVDNEAVVTAEASTLPSGTAPVTTPELEGPQRRGNKRTDNDTKTSAVQHASATEPAHKLREKTQSDSPTAKSDPNAVAGIEQLQAERSQNEPDKDRHNDRREKWFERDARSSAGTESEGDVTANARTATKELEAVSNASDIAAPETQAPDVIAQLPPDSLPTPTPATTAPMPSAMPLSPTASVQVNAASAESSGSATTETNSLGPTAPTRTVGTQAAKADSKNDVERSEVTQQERVRVIQRIARSFNRISAEGGTINLRLHPEHLGSVTVQVRMEGRSMSAKLLTETPAARDAIMADLPVLRQRLADQGFDVTKFQVDVTENGADSTFAQTDGQNTSGQSNSGSYGERSTASQIDYRRVAANRAAQLAFAKQTPTTYPTLSGSGIDVHA